VVAVLLLLLLFESPPKAAISRPTAATMIRSSAGAPGVFRLLFVGAGT
jgi:hypothetical protein